MTPPYPSESPVRPLALHPSCPAGAVRGVSVRVRREGDALVLEYLLEGRLHRLVLPEPGEPMRHNGLWRHTCFEAFVRVAGEAGYAEVNVSPSAEWAAYRFDGYRDGMRDLELPETPSLHLQTGADRLDATVRAVLPDPWAGARSLDVGVAVVTEDADGTLEYWALAHPAGAPDFHHPGGFAVTLGRG